MEKRELETMLAELDDALVIHFPDAPPIQALMVGGASLVFQEIITRQTSDIDLIIFDLMGSDEERSLIYSTPLADQIRAIVMRIGRRHGLRGDRRMFFNDDCSSFLLELSDGELPELRLWGAYKKIRQYLPNDFGYILACKLMAGRPDKDFEDIAALCQLLGVTTREQAQSIVNSFFPEPTHQIVYQLPATLDIIFPENTEI